jgi:hypothetical protein
MRACLGIAATVAVLALPAAAPAQGLGDAAKKEKERRASSPAPKGRTYTQEELAKLPPVANEPGPAPEGAPPVAAAPSTAPAADPAPPADAQAVDEEAERRAEAEETWRARVAEARQKVDAARKKHDTLASLNLVPGYEYVDASGRTVIGSIGQLQALTARAKADLEAAEKELEDLLEAARRANVPPGWLR